MRILLVNYEYPEYTSNCGGGGRIAKTLVEELRKKHEVRVVTDGRDAHRSPFARYSTFAFRAHSELNVQIEEFDPDVVHGCFSIPTSLGLPRLCNAHDVPLVVTVMGADVYDPTRYSAIRPFLDVANRYVLGRADAVVAPSSNMARLVRDKYGIDSRVIHYGINPDEHTWLEKNVHDRVRVLTVARLVDRKNHDVAREAVERLHNAQYRVVGTGPLSDELAQHESESYSCLGFVEDLGRQFEWADVFLLPSEHEAFGIVLLEALASGLPVVTSNFGGQTDIVSPDVGRCVDPTPSAQYGALRDVVADYDRMQAATRGYVESNFSSTAMAAEYDSLYKSLNE